MERWLRGAQKVFSTMTEHENKCHCRLPDSERLLSNAEAAQILAERAASGKQTSKAIAAAEAKARLDIRVLLVYAPSHRFYAKVMVCFYFEPLTSEQRAVQVHDYLVSHSGSPSQEELREFLAAVKVVFALGCLDRSSNDGNFTHRESKNASPRAFFMVATLTTVTCVLQKFDLTKPDILQILNLRPRYPVELALIGSQQDVSHLPAALLCIFELGKSYLKCFSNLDIR